MVIKEKNENQKNEGYVVDQCRENDDVDEGKKEEDDKVE